MFAGGSGKRSLKGGEEELEGRNPEMFAGGSRKKSLKGVEGKRDAGLEEEA